MEGSVISDNVDTALNKLKDYYNITDERDSFTMVFNCDDSSLIKFRHGEDTLRVDSRDFVKLFKYNINAFDCKDSIQYFGTDVIKDTLYLDPISFKNFVLVPYETIPDKVEMEVYSRI